MPNITITRAQTQALLDFCEKHNLSKWFLAKDQGAYIGAAATVDGEVQNIIYYFRGCDPHKNDDWYDEAHYKFGGDDFGQHFEVDILRKVLSNETMVSFIVSVGKTQISFKTKHKRPSAAAPKPSAPKKPQPQTGFKTIGALVEHLIKQEWSNEGILQAVKSHFPNANTSNASVNWYRSKLRKAA